MFAVSALQYFVGTGSTIYSVGKYWDGTGKPIFGRHNTILRVQRFYRGNFVEELILARAKALRTAFKNAAQSVDGPAACRYVA